MFPAQLPFRSLFSLLVLCLSILGFPPLAAGSGIVAESADERALVEALEAARRRDDGAARVAAARVDPDHPLADYPAFWRLRMRLDSRIDDPEPAALDAEIAAYIDARPDTVVADRLLTDWLRSLGRRSAWRLFDAYFPRWRSRGDDAVWCLAGVSRVEQRLPVADETMQVWRDRRELGDDCERLTLALYEAGRLPAAQIDLRLRAALEDKAVDTIRVLGRLLGIGADDLSTAIRSPARALASSRDPRVTLIALGLLARPSPDVAAARLAERSDLAEADRHLLWAIIGASAARDVDRRAWQWARQGLAARAGRDTREWLVRAAMLADDWPGVLQAIDRLDESTAATPGWTYWRARALDATGAPDAARALRTLIAGREGFYPMLAAEESGDVPTAAAAAPPEPTPTVDPSAFAARPAARRALALYRLGLHGDALREWIDAIRDATDAELLAAARLACDQGLFDRCIATASRLRAYDDRSLRYPMPFSAPLEASARRHGLDPAWMYGLIRQESRFTATARSGVGAKGLMQVMPATGRWIARKRGIGGFRVASLDDPTTNLDFGAWYMRHVLDGVGGSMLLASAGYNAGPGRPPRWRASIGRPVDGALYAELIPFRETRHYVQSVLANTVIYGEILGSAPRSLRALLGRVSPEQVPGDEDPAPEPDAGPTADEDFALLRPSGRP